MAPSVVTGVIGGTPWGFVFQSPAILWLADSSALATAHVYGWTLSGGAWTRGTAVLFSTSLPVYSITGRPELSGSTYRLYAMAVSTTSDAYSVWQYDVNSQIANEVLFNAGGGLAPYRAVMLPPFNPSASASPTQTPSHTGTPSSSATLSQTPSISASASLTASNTPSNR